METLQNGLQTLSGRTLICYRSHPKDREGNVFIGVCPPTGGEGVPTLARSTWGRGTPRYLPPSQVRLGEGYPNVPNPSPCQVRMGGRVGVPQGTYPPSLPGQDGGKGGGTPRYLPPLPRPRTCYTAGGMPLAFTQEDFLVSIVFNETNIARSSVNAEFTLQ